MNSRRPKNALDRAPEGVEEAFIKEEDYIDELGENKKRYVEDEVKKEAYELDRKAREASERDREDREKSRLALLASADVDNMDMGQLKALIKVMLKEMLRE